MTPNVEAARRAVHAMLAALGHDPDSDGLKETPRRVVSAFQEMTSGYADDPAKHLAVTFEAKYDEVVALADVPFVSMCEHHLLPFTGKAGIAYLPNGRVVGLSKLARVIDTYARRLQLQERMTEQIANAVETHLRPRGIAVVVEAVHSCMVCRGAMKPGAVMRTSSLRGSFHDDIAARSEVLGMLRTS